MPLHRCLTHRLLRRRANWRHKAKCIARASVHPPNVPAASLMVPVKVRRRRYSPPRICSGWGRDSHQPRFRMPHPHQPRLDPAICPRNSMRRISHISSMCRPWSMELINRLRTARRLAWPVGRTATTLHPRRHRSPGQRACLDRGHSRCRWAAPIHPQQFCSQVPAEG